MTSPILGALWTNAQSILVELAARGRGALVVESLRPDIVSALGARGVELIPLPAVASDLAAARAAAASAAAPLLPGLVAAAGFGGDESATVTATAARVLDESFAASAALIDRLDEIHAARPLDGVLLSESETVRGATAAAWARARGIPVALVGHGLMIGGYFGSAYAPANVDAVFVPGPRGVDNQVEGGVARERCVALGAPWFDELAARTPALLAARDAIRERFGIPPVAPVAVFATSFFHGLTAVDDPDRDRRAIAAFIVACAALRERGIPVEIVVKGRPALAHEVAAATIREIAASTGVDDVRYVVGDMAEAIAAADVLVVQDGAAAMEAAVLGVPSVNLWDPSQWATGPAFAEPDGVPLAVDAADLASLLEPLLRDADARAAAVAEVQAALPRFHAARPGGSAAAIAAQLDKLFPKTAPRSHVWQLLSEPADAATDPHLRQYYANARPEVVALVDREPRRLIEFGCAGGGTGAAIKAKYPQAEVIGVELNASAAAIARTRLDRVLSDDIERIDYGAHGIAPQSVDAAIFADVLEHLRDPWRALVNLRPVLSPQAQLYCSIPNVRNLWLIEKLVGGDWTYEREGLLDVTHIRFFTLREMRKMFEETGYVVERIGGVADPRGAGLPAVLPEGQSDVTTPHTVFRGLTQGDYDELRTIQFLIVARPV